MDYLYCAGIGYALGCISPSYIIGKIKRIDLRKCGTKNLGASNTFLNFGRAWGTFVLLFDIFKAFIAVKIAGLWFYDIMISGILAGCFAVIGHNYPFYIGFKGGQGLASYSGLVLAIDPKLFVMLLLLCVFLSVLLNYGCVIALSATLLFPILLGISGADVYTFTIAVVCSASVFFKHTENIKRIKNGEENKLSSFIEKYILKITGENKNRS